MGQLRDGVISAVRWTAGPASPVTNPLGELLGHTHAPAHRSPPLRPQPSFGLGLRRRAAARAQPAMASWCAANSAAAKSPPAARQWCDAGCCEFCGAARWPLGRRQSRSARRYGRFCRPGGTFRRQLRASTARSSISSPALDTGLGDRTAVLLRIRDYSPAMLDELLASRDVTWSGAGSISNGCPAPRRLGAQLTLAEPAGNRLHRRPRAIAPAWSWRIVLLPQLAHDGGLTEAELRSRSARVIWAGRVTAETRSHRYARYSARRAPGSDAAPRGGHRPPRLSDTASRTRPGTTLTRPCAGRWSRCLPNRTPLRAVPSRAAVEPPRRVDQRRSCCRGCGGRVRDALPGCSSAFRGCSVASSRWGALSSPVASTVDRRSYLDGVDPEQPVYHAVVLAAAGPAARMGRRCPGPASSADEHRPAGPQSRRTGRSGGRRVGLVSSVGGRSLLTFTDPEASHAAATIGLAFWSPPGLRRVDSGRAGRPGMPVLQPGGRASAALSGAAGSRLRPHTSRCGGVKPPEGDTVWHTAATLQRHHGRSHVDVATSGCHVCRRRPHRRGEWTR